MSAKTKPYTACQKAKPVSSAPAAIPQSEPIVLDYLTPSQVSALTGVPENTLSQWRYLRINLDYFKIGRRVCYEAAEVKRFIESNRVRIGSKNWKDN